MTMDGGFASVKINKAKPNSYYENMPEPETVTLIIPELIKEEFPA